VVIDACASGDGCCPEGCNTDPSNIDADCDAVCGNGEVESGEICDTGIAPGQPDACPTSCDDGESCTRDTLEDPDTCQARCTPTPITQCSLEDDGCCAPGCDGATDGDCPVDLGGTWVSNVITTGTFTAPVVGALPANIDIVLRIVVSQTEGTLENHAQFCRVNTHAATMGIDAVVDLPESVLNLLAGDASVPLPVITLGDPVPIPSFTFRAGQDEAGMPVDSDGDGTLGVRVPVVLNGGTPLPVDVGLEITLGFPTATLDGVDTQSRESDFLTAGNVFAPALFAGPISVTPTDPPTPFTSTRLPGDVPCSEVLSMFP